jgi:hypothetical protein
MTPAARTVATLLAFLLLALPAAVAAAAEPPGAETPEALVARMQAAAEKQDLPEMMACVAPTSRREMALAMVAGTGMMVAFMGMGGEMAGAMGEAVAEGLSGDEAAGDEASAQQEAETEKGQAALQAKTAEISKSFEAILDRHGVTEMMNDESPLPEDPAARSAALEKMFAKTDDIALMTDLMGLMEQLGDPSEEKGEIPPPVPVSDTVTDYQVDGDRATARSGEETLEFVRVDGRWYFEPGDSLPGAPPSAP